MVDQPTDPQLDTPADPPSSAQAAAADHANAVPAADVADLKRERDDLYDRLLRTTAEFDNYRKRIDRERREHANETVIQILLDLLLIVDDFDRALAVDAQKDPSAYRKGVEMIHAKLHDLLRKQNVRPIESVGMDFDPTLHQAVVYEESAAHRDGEVIAELQRGYQIGERLLRAAMVKVAKA
jgi:molecular chaperone GrpE